MSGERLDVEALLTAFGRDGFAYVRSAVPRATMAAVHAQLAAELSSPTIATESGELRAPGGEPISLERPETWPAADSRRVAEVTPPGGSAAWDDLVRSERLGRALDALLGEGCWEMPTNAPAPADGGQPAVRHWYAPVTFPQPASEHPLSWAPVNRRGQRWRGWHIDIGPGFSTDQSRTVCGHAYQGVVVLVLGTASGPGGGGTALIRGSHRWVDAALRQAGEGGLTHQELNGWVTREAAARRAAGLLRLPGEMGGGVDSKPRAAAEEGDDGAEAEEDDGGAELHQACGRPGDVLLLHPWLVHSGTTNCSAHPEYARPDDPAIPIDPEYARPGDPAIPLDPGYARPGDAASPTEPVRAPAGRVGSGSPCAAAAPDPGLLPLGSPSLTRIPDKGGIAAVGIPRILYNGMARVTSRAFAERGCQSLRLLTATAHRHRASGAQRTQQARTPDVVSSEAADARDGRAVGAASGAGYGDRRSGSLVCSEPPSYRLCRLLEPPPRRAIAQHAGALAAAVAAAAAAVESGAAPRAPVDWSLPAVSVIVLPVSGGCRAGASCCSVAAAAGGAAREHAGSFGSFASHGCCCGGGRAPCRARGCRAGCGCAACGGLVESLRSVLVQSYRGQIEVSLALGEGAASGCGDRCGGCSRARGGGGSGSDGGSDSGDDSDDDGRSDGSGGGGSDRARKDAADTGAHVLRWVARLRASGIGVVLSGEGRPAAAGAAAAPPPLSAAAAAAAASDERSRSPSGGAGAAGSCGHPKAGQSGGHEGAAAAPAHAPSASAAACTHRRASSSALHRAVSQSSGAVLVLLRAGDIMLPGRIAAQVGALASQPRALIGCGWLRLPEGSTAHFEAWANALSTRELWLQQYREVTLPAAGWCLARDTYERAAARVEALARAAAGPEDAAAAIAAAAGRGSTLLAGAQCRGWGCGVGVRGAAEEEEDGCVHLLHAHLDEHARLHASALAAAEAGRGAPLPQLQHPPHAGSADATLRAALEASPPLLRIGSRHAPLLLHRWHGDEGCHASDAAIVTAGVDTATSVSATAAPQEGSCGGSVRRAERRHSLLRVRVAAFERRVLSLPSWATFTVWGAGREGRRFVSALSPAARCRVVALADVDPKKVGSRYLNQRVRPPISLPIIHTAAIRTPAVVCVALRRADEAQADTSASAGAPSELRHAAAALGLVEGLTLWHIS